MEVGSMWEEVQIPVKKVSPKVKMMICGNIKKLLKEQTNWQTAVIGDPIVGGDSNFDNQTLLDSSLCPVWMKKYMATSHSIRGQSRFLQVYR